MDTEIDDPLRLDRQVCFALAVANRAVLAVYRPLLEPMGLTHPQYLVMLALWGSAPMSVKEIAEAIQLDSPTLSPLLKRLHSAGLITRERDPRDERNLVIDLTEQGRALRRQAEAIPPAVVQRLGVSLADLEELHTVLTRVNDAARRSVLAESTPSEADRAPTETDLAHTEGARS
ncbi:MarR family transcriptional regulator [Nocardia cyriacigeorgica]|uniref:MarR family transcriptional regulator n=1 Tax=Nocardia cyriacigeorgica TaxID=135487 RepID=A0A6P1D746_9NOCA|nr:MarR family transcriptional regulator [Nocardia cyriacigeorgica]NEW41936.1 MarR family transcriptional regulator [Nocardia cyriacigeorgica]NEW46456.1 MarR family transcriptional regulator [Nocardia cyriacigeorgica]NEW53034.1 MarR family transcriptional regulator [Nocardia cyriacigeorgica]